MALSTSANIRLSQVITEVGLPTNSSLADCFAAANGSFHTSYVGNKDRLSNFRGYNHSLQGSTYAHSLGFDGSSSANSCNDSQFSPSTYWTNNSNWDLSSALWTNSSGSSQAPAGIYSNGTTWRSWDGSKFTASGSCSGGA